MRNTRALVRRTLFCLFGLTAFSVAAQEALQVDTAGNVQVEHAIVRAGNTYDALPVGTILMYDGAGWVDDETIPGWFACTEENSRIEPDSPIGAIVGIPNLEDHFIVGVAPDELEGYVDDRFGGSNDVTLTEAQMPSHTHGIDHDHVSTRFTTLGAGSHSHTYLDEYFPDSGHYDGDSGNENDVARVHVAGNAVATRTTNAAGEHAHAIDVDLPPTSGMVSASTGGDQPFDNRPAFYTVIYIRKSYQPIAP